MPIITRDISVLYRKMQMGFDKLLAPLGLTNGKVMFLFCLDDNGAITQNQICKELDMDKSTVAKMLTKLEKEGFIYKRINPDDSRAFLVELSAKAHEIMSSARKAHDTWVQLVTSDLTDIEKNIFIELVHKVSQKSILLADDDSRV